MSRFCFSLLSLLLVGCGRQAVSLSAGHFDAAAPGDSLYAVRIPVGTEYMGEYPVQVAGDRIVMHNLGVSEKKFSVYRFSGDSLKKEGEFLGYGRGPYEMMIARVAFDPFAGFRSILLKIFTMSRPGSTGSCRLSVTVHWANPV